MEFEIEGKVALVTGGAAGIGLSCVEQLLRNGAKGVTIADINSEDGQNVVKDIEKEFGEKRVIFVKTDVTSKLDFEEAFKKTIAAFKNVDILVNCAGIYDEKNWEQMVAINFNGVVNGIILSFHDYLSKYKQGSTALVVNIASITAVRTIPGIPIYSSIKAGVVSMTKSWGLGSIFDQTKIRVVALCPGFTKTKMTGTTGKALGKLYEDVLYSIKDTLVYQSAENCGRALVEIARKASNGSVWISEAGLPVYQIDIPEFDIRT